VSRVCEYITQHLDEELSLDVLSQVAHFSRFHFHRQFVEYTGITLHRFIQLMRMKRASYRLAYQQDDKIIDIALQAQFENPESFSRAFKKAFGQTPSQFRKQPEWPNWHSKYQFAVPSQEGVEPMDIKIVDFPQTQVAILPHRGPVKLLDETVDRFIEWRQQSGLSPVESSSTYGIAYDDPVTTEPDAFRFDICGAVDAAVPENVQGVENGVIPSGRCAVMRHYGDTDEISTSIHAMFAQWLPDSGEELRDYPVFFNYLKIKPAVAKHEQETDIYLPLK
jgi:AraC family transcriptional regulator